MKLLDLLILLLNVDKFFSVSDHWVQVRWLIFHLIFGEANGVRDRTPGEVLFCQAWHERRLHLGCRWCLAYVKWWKKEENSYMLCLVQFQHTHRFAELRVEFRDALKAAGKDPLHQVSNAARSYDNLFDNEL